MTSSSLLVSTALCALLAACSSSSSSTDETPDAGHPNDASAHDARTKDVDVVHDAGVDVPPQPVFSADAGSTWTALYRDYFGNDTAVHTAGCSNGGYCHGSTAMSAQGFQGSQFLCPKGDKETCYKSFTAQDAGAAQLVTPDAGWENDILSTTLCEVDDAGDSIGGGMPYDCVYNFTPTDIARIKAWIAAGYPDN
jgi:hypothetical protein